MRLAIVGSRDFTDEAKAKEIMYDFCDIWYPEVILSGEARGVDTFAKEFAFTHGIDYEPYPADWKQGRHAGFERNTLMAQVCDEALVFWNWKSPGTRHMINELYKARKPYMHYDYTGDEFFFPHAFRRDV